MIFLKLFIALILSLSWYFIDGNLEFAVILFVFLVVVLLFQLTKTKSIQEQDFFKDKVNKANERKMQLEERRIMEQKEADKQKQLKEN